MPADEWGIDLAETSVASGQHPLFQSAHLQVRGQEAAIDLKAGAGSS